MRVTNGGHTCLEAPAKAESAENELTRDFYTQLPQIRLTGDPITRPMQRKTPPETPIEVMLDGNDVARLVECAIRHPAFNMRYAVLTAIWNHPASFRQIFRFGLDASPAFSEIRDIVAEELDKCAAASEVRASNAIKPADSKALLPRMPLPPHLRDRQRQ
jgi:hypothetical protein